MGMNSWKSQWTELERLLNAAGFTSSSVGGPNRPPRFEIDPPATDQEVRAIELELGMPIPASMRRVFLEFSSRVWIEWDLPDGRTVPQQFDGIFSGGCRWDLKSLPGLAKSHQDWITNCFTGMPRPEWQDGEVEEDVLKYDLVWHNKFAILDIPNGDMLGIDLAPDSGGAVIYLSHEDGECHGFRLGKDFEDYIDRLTGLAFVGAEDWQLECFLPDATNGLVNNGEAYDAWRRWLAEQAGEA